MLYRIAFALVLMLAPAAADDAVPARGAIVLAIADGIIAPRYDALAEAASRQLDIWRDACRAAAAFEQARPMLADAFQLTASAWSAIEFLRYGPVMDELRAERMAHWPERRNVVGRALSALLARADGPDLARLRQASVAGQGLSALERLVFPQPGEMDGVHRERICIVGTVIAANVAAMAEDIRDGWRGPGGLLIRLRAGDEALLREAATRFATDHLTMLEALAETKLAVVLGDTVENANPRAAEGWRAARTARAIAANLVTAREIGRAITPPAHDKAGRALDKGFGDAAEALTSLGTTGLGDAAADTQMRRKVLLLQNLIASVKAQSETLIPERLGVVVGFNSRDGD